MVKTLLKSTSGGRKLRQILWALLALCSANVRADSLTDRVLAAFSHQRPDLSATVKSDDEIHLGAPIGPVTVFLDRIRADCSKRPLDCDSVIKNFVQSTLLTFSQPDKMRFNAERVYPVIRPSGMLTAMQGTVGGDVAKLFVSRPYISGAVLLYAIDAPQAIRFVNNSDLEHAGLTMDALEKLAVAHVSRLPPLNIAPTQAAGIWSALATDGYGTSRLFDPKFWDALEARAGGAVAVALPTRDWLLAARLDDSDAIARMRILAARIVAGESTAVTSSLVRRDGNGWSEVAIDR